MPSQSIPRPSLVPAVGDLPVLLSIPHAGRAYPRWLVDLSLRGRRSLSPLEDPLVDQLAARAMALGVGAVLARAPRALVDCNRSPLEIDPAVVALPAAGEPGPRARGGLGVVPARTAAGPLWRRRLSAAEFAERMSGAHAPYHSAVAAALARLRERHGAALLIDCHSMPPRRDEPQIVIGDRHGASAAPWLTAAAATSARDAGYSVALNDPYAGGWIVEHHGRPDRAIHAIQVEIDRNYYLDAGLSQPGPGFDRAARMFEALVVALGCQLAERSTSIAAQ